jgi:superfamily I DNA/RNA helicase
MDEPNHIMVLKAIAELKFGVGRRFMTDILIGSATERVKGHGFHKNKYFGSLGAFTQEEIRRLLNELDFKGFIEVKRPDPNKFYRVVCLTEKGKKEILEENGFVSNELSLKIEDVTEKDKGLFSLFGGFLDNLNPYQKKAVIDNTKEILCIAGAGTGKTTVLTKRIEFLSRLKNVPDDKILAITFTRKARKEMITRLEDKVPGHGFQIETFNSFCEKMLIKHGHLIYGKKYAVLDFRKKILLINKILKDLDHTPESATDLYFSHRKFIAEDKHTLHLRFINDLFAVMDHYRNSGKDFSSLKEVALNLGYADKAVANLVLNVVEKIITYKREFGFRDYTDQIIHTMKLFSLFPETVPSFEHVLVDEYQDVNNMQIKLLDYLKPKNIFMVGDPRQSIFGWRGSNIRHIIGFKERYPKGKVLGLSINYRSKEGIIKVLNSVIAPMKIPDVTCSEKNRSNEKSVLLLDHDNEEREELFVVQSILSLSIKRKDVFVLARTNKQLEKMALRLKKAGIDFIKKTVEKPNAEARDNQVTLSTVHAIKGLEAEIVYLIGANSFSFPCRASEHPILDILKTNDCYDKYDEELRVLYVALSRAKSKLVINYYSTLTPFINERTAKLIENIRISKKSPDNTLFGKLKNWRLEKSRELNVKAFQIFSDKTLIEICQTGPTTKEELYDIHGMGPTKVKRYGKDILNIVG